MFFKRSSLRQLEPMKSLWRGMIFWSHLWWFKSIQRDVYLFSQTFNFQFNTWILFLNFDLWLRTWIRSFSSTLSWILFNHTWEKRLSNLFLNLIWSFFCNCYSFSFFRFQFQILNLRWFSYTWSKRFLRTWHWLFFHLRKIIKIKWSSYIKSRSWFLSLSKHICYFDSLLIHLTRLSGCVF